MNFAFTLVLASILDLASCCYPTNVCHADKYQNNAEGYKYICDNTGDIWIEHYADSECSTLATSTLADINDYEVQTVQCDGCTDYTHGRKYYVDDFANCDYDADFGELMASLGCLLYGDGSESEYVECDNHSSTVYHYDTNSVCDGIPDESITYNVGCGVNAIQQANGTVYEIPMFLEGFHCGSASTTSASTTSASTTSASTTSYPTTLRPATTNNSSNPTSNVLATDIMTSDPNVNNSKPETVEILFFVCIFTILLFMV
eukprot:118738_1